MKLAPLLAAAASLALPASSQAAAQVRGAPVFFDPSYSYDTRLGVDVAHGGETNGLVLAASASRLFYAGNCRRVGISVAIGLWNSPLPGFQRHANGGAGASYLVNRCPRPTSAPNPTARLVGGAGFTRVNGFTAFHGYVGGGGGYMLEIPIGRLEPWVTPRLHYRDSLQDPDGSSTDFAVSAGFNFGVGTYFGIRVAVDCCVEGPGGGYGLSLWW